MDRDCDIGRLTYEEFYGGELSRDSIIEMLSNFDIPLCDSHGNSRKTSELIDELLHIRRTTASFRDVRIIGDVIMTLARADELTNNLSLDEKEISTELDSFLESFKIVQGGVSL